MKASISFLSLFLFSIICIAQEFKYKADFQKVDSNGYYCLILEPKIVDHLNHYNADLRIFDNNGREIAYLLEEHNAQDTLRENFLIKGINFKQIEDVRTKQSRVKVNFKEYKRINKIRFELQGSPNYFRYGEIRYYDTLNLSKRRKRHYRPETISMSVSSDTSVDYQIPETRIKGLEILIFNEDNQPLKFTSVNIFQPKYYLIVYLKKNQSYTLKFGGVNIDLPNYDLKYFKNKLPRNLSNVKLGMISLFDNNSISRPKKFYETKVFLWVIIISMIIVMVFFSIKIIKEMGRKSPK